MIRISEQDEFLLSQLLDGELSAADAEALRGRLASEPLLRETLEGLEQVNGLLAARRAHVARVDSASLRGEIMEAIRATAGPSVIRFPLWRWSAGALAAAAAIAIIFVAYRPSQPVQQPPGQMFARNSVPRVAIPTVEFSGRELAMASDRGPIQVSFNQPAYESTDNSIGTVSYAQSSELEQDMKARDEERLSRPAIRVVVAQRAGRVPVAAAAVSPFDAPL